MKPLCRFAQPIAEARKRGKRPANLVLVSDGDLGLHRKFPDNPVVLVAPKERPDAFDWWWAADLDVEIVTTGDGPRVAALIDAVLSGKPYGLWVWRIDTGARTRVRWLGRMWYSNEREGGINRKSEHEEP